MKNKKFSQALTALTLAACAGVSAGLHAGVPKYEVTTFVKPVNLTGVHAFAPTVLNNKGEVAGLWETKNATGGWLMQPNGAVIILSNLIPDPCGQGFGYSTGIIDLNDRAQIVGYCETEDNLRKELMAMLYTLSDGPIILSEQSSGTWANAINDAEQIVGISGSEAVVFFQNGTLMNLGTFGNSSSYMSEAYDINERYGADGFGQIVGTSMSTYVPYASNGQVFLYENGVMSNIGQIICPDVISMPRKINNKGEIAGYCEPGLMNGFIYGTTTGSYALFPGLPLYSINDEGWAIGLSEDDGYSYLVIDGIRYKLIDLILPIFGITEIYMVYDINDLGQILADTNLGYVLLTPIS